MAAAYRTTGGFYAAGIHARRDSSTEDDVRLLRTATVAIVLAASWTPPSAASPEGQRVWFKFNKAFINAHYTGGHAFATVTAQTWSAAANVHSSSCGDNDAELHIGALETGVSLPSSQSPISGKATATVVSRFG
jgi:hypothetical protein